MKKICLNALLLFTLTTLVAIDLSAQRTSRRRGGVTPPPAEPASDNVPRKPTPGQPVQSNTNNQGDYNPYGNLPVRYDTLSPDQATSKSLRPNSVFDKSLVNERVPLDYEHLRWDDALFAEKVWRELDLREKINQTFRYKGEGDNGSEMFVNILLKAVTEGGITPFADDRFSQPMTGGEVLQLTAGEITEELVYDINDISKVTGVVRTRSAFDAETVTKLRIKEEWVFDREASRMFCRILGIAPVKTTYLPNGTERNSVMFWVYYPDLRPTFAKYEVYNPKNMGNSRMTWEELFESRMFSSYITKSSIENAANRNIRQYIKDPILALLEGENIKEKIFNYEQDLWSY